MRTEAIFCDNCRSDLTTSQGTCGYRTVLQAEQIPARGNMVAPTHVRPEPERPHHFCNIACLVQFLEKHRSTFAT